MRIWDEELKKLSEEYNKPGIRVLDVGVAGDKEPGGHYHLFDKTEYKTLDKSDALFADYVMDICKTDFVDNEWDLVLVMCVIEHIPQSYRAIKEAKRIGKLAVFGFPLVPDNNEFEEKTYPITLDTILKKAVNYRLRVWDNRIAYLEVF